MRNEPYWFSTESAPPGAADAPAPGPPPADAGEPADGPPPDAADVAVVGGGFAGLSVSLHLAQAGWRVVLLEAGRLAHGASGRNAGHLMSGTAEFANRAVESWGAERLALVWRMHRANTDLWEMLLGPRAAACGFQRRGNVYLASTEPERRELEASLAVIARLGLSAARWWEPAEAARALGHEGAAGLFHGGLFVPEDATLHPYRAARVLADQTRAAGVRLYEHCPVRAVRATADGVALDMQPAGTEHPATLRAELAVLSCNAWLSTLAPALAGLVEPVRGQCLATRPADADLGRGRAFCANQLFEYWHQGPEGVVVMGGWRWAVPGKEVGVFDQDAVHETVHAGLVEYLRAVYGPRAPAPAFRWSGIMGFSRDGLPLIGPLPGQGRVFVLGGWTGHGLSTALLAGRLAAQMISGVAPEFPLAAFAPRRLLV